jgi:hypothetical protein
MRMIQAMSTLVLILSAGVAFGGATRNVPVKITTWPSGGGSAEGSISGARNSANNKEYISCTFDATDVGYWGSCRAVDANNVTRFCGSLSESQKEIVRSITSRSYIYFAWNSYGECTYVRVEMNSRDT